MQFQQCLHSTFHKSSAFPKKTLSIEITHVNQWFKKNSIWVSFKRFLCLTSLIDKAWSCSYYWFSRCLQIWMIHSTMRSAVYHPSDLRQNTLFEQVTGFVSVFVSLPPQRASFPENTANITIKYDRISLSTRPVVMSFELFMNWQQHKVGISDKYFLSFYFLWWYQL